MPNTIIKASAGSGKTFQLSNEFLRILLRSDHKHIGDRLDAILASTFTRKAAGEILDRILNRLAEAALDENGTKQDELNEHVPLPYTGLSERTGFLQKTVAELAQNLYRIRISTLDAFFNKIATVFSLELALPPGWEIMDNTEYNRSIHEAVQQVLEESHNNEALRLMHLLNKGEEDQSVSKELAALADGLLPLVRTTSADAWDHTDKPLGLYAARKMSPEELQRCIEMFDDENKRFECLPKNAPKKKGASPELDKNYVSAWKTFQETFISQDWQKVFEAGFGKAYYSSEKKYQKKELPEELIEFIEPMIHHAGAILAEIAIHQTQAVRGLLDLIAEKLQSILRQKRGLQFDDITLLLEEKFGNPDALPQPLLSHRIDAPTKHLLLDEFQDTSLPQWNVLKPFVESVSTGSHPSFFCVGDLKQAIYGWRGGEAEIFEAVEQYLQTVGAQTPETPSMNATRRNSQAVIDAVNAVFKKIDQNEAVDEKSKDAGKKWAEWFGKKEHETLSKNKDQGYCVLEAVPSEKIESVADDEEESEAINIKEPFWQYTLNRIVELHHKHHSRSIGVLFRKRKHIAKILKGLKEHGIEASDEGGVYLTDSAAVQQILSLMTLIDHPGDTITRFHLATGPLSEAISFTDYTDDDKANKTAQFFRRKILSEGFGNTVKSLIHHLTPCEPKEMQRLEKLLELAYQFDGKAIGTRTRQFIEAVQAARAESPSAANVRVMTIHKSKGLEFDIVVLPDLKSPLTGDHTPEVVVSPILPDVKPFVIKWVKADVQKAFPKECKDAYKGWETDQVKESLAVLYVAMTRARHALVMLIPEKPSKGTYAKVLHSALAGNSSTDTSGTLLYQSGTPDWETPNTVDVLADVVAGVVADASPIPEPIRWRPLATKPILRNLPRAKPSGMEIPMPPRYAEEPMRTAEYSQAMYSQTMYSQEEASLRGTAIHACFAAVGWFDEGEQKDAAALLKIVQQTLQGKQEIADSESIVKEFLEMCKYTEVRKCLLRESYPKTETVDVEPERRFAVHWKGKLLHGSMDRLVIRRVNESVVGLEIIDFKTDRVPEGQSVRDFLSERTNHYMGQMRAYREAAAKLYPKVQNITAKFVFASVNKICDCN